MIVSVNLTNTFKCNTVPPMCLSQQTQICCSKTSLSLQQKYACSGKTFSSSWQKYFCCNKHVFVLLQQAYFCRNKRCVCFLQQMHVRHDKCKLVMTNILSWQNYVCGHKYLLRQNFCCNKNMFAVTSKLLSWQNFCHDKIILVAAPANDSFLAVTAKTLTAIQVLSSDHWLQD